MSAAFESHTGGWAHVGPWTVEDVEALPDLGDHSKHELLTPGVLTVSPAPGTKHQRASLRLAVALDTAAEAADADVEVLENVDVIVGDGRMAQPDIALVDREPAATDPTRYPAGSVLLVVEIVSPGSEPADRHVKPGLYAAAGVTIYWRFELGLRPHIVVHELRDGQFVETATAHAGVSTKITAPFPIEIDPGKLVRQQRN